MFGAINRRGVAVAPTGSAEIFDVAATFRNRIATP
jgi:hypothetical protein